MALLLQYVIVGFSYAPESETSQRSWKADETFCLPFAAVPGMRVSSAFTQHKSCADSKMFPRLHCCIAFRRIT